MFLQSILHRLAQIAPSSVSPGPVWPEWDIWLWILSYTNCSWMPFFRMCHMAACWFVCRLCSFAPTHRNNQREYL